MTALRALPLLSRPVTRGDCVTVPRPCPWSECRYHLEADPDLSCALDVADEGGADLETVGRAVGFTRQRAQQIEELALRKMAKRGVRLREWLAKEAR